MLQKIADKIDALNDLIGRASSWMLLLMVVITFLIATLRYIFHVNWIWLQDSVTYMHGSLFMLAGAYALLHSEHVRVDVFYSKMNPQTKAKINIFGTLCLLAPFCLLILLGSSQFVASSWRIFEGSKETGGLGGVFILKTMIPIFAILLLLQGISEFCKNLLILKEED